jgi:tight adherence protein C
MMTPPLILIGCAALMVLSILGIVLLMLFGGSASKESNRLESLSNGQTGSRHGMRGGSHDGSGRAQSGGSNSRTGSRTGSRASSQDASERMSERLVQAGLYRRDSMGYYVFTKLALALVPIGIGLGVAAAGLVTLLQGILIGGVLAMLGTIVPSFWLDSKKRKRQLNISRALPDALDVIVVCLEAGLSLRAGISRVAKELKSTHPLLAAELLIVEREIQLGCSGGDALKRFANRFDMEELRSLASVVMQAEKFGASIAQALRVHADGLRTKRFQSAEERAHKASVKLLFPTMFCIFPTLYVVLIGPAVIEMVSFFSTFNQ